MQGGLQVWHADVHTCPQGGAEPLTRHDSGLEPNLRIATQKFHVEAVMIHKLGFDENFYTFTLILLRNVVMCGKFL